MRSQLPGTTPLRLALPGRLAGALAVTLDAWRTQEALTNVARYAAAEHGWVTVARRNGCLEIEVSDDAQATQTRSAAAAERARRPRRCTRRPPAARQPPGAGTRVVAEIA